MYLAGVLERRVVSPTSLLYGYEKFKTYFVLVNTSVNRIWESV